MKDITFAVTDLMVQLKTFEEKLNKLQRNCIGCGSFSKSTYFCNAWDAQVPAETIVTGCDRFDFGIPF
jgi:hypothetical protein